MCIFMAPNVAKRLPLTQYGQQKILRRIIFFQFRPFLLMYLYKKNYVRQALINLHAPFCVDQGAIIAKRRYLAMIEETQRR